MDEENVPTINARRIAWSGKQTMTPPQRSPFLYGLSAVAVLVFALWLRISAAGISYPAQGDASHFIQHGVRWAVTGEDISGYWSIAPQYLAGWAYKQGLDPSQVLQVTTVGFGVLLVASTMLLGLVMGLPPIPVILSGLVVATNPPLLFSSTGGLSETPLIALLMLGFAGLERSQQRNAWCWAILGSISLAAAMYYRPFEVFVGMGAFSAHAAILHVIGKRKLLVRPLLVAAAVYMAGAAPYFIASAKLDALSAGKSKLVNLAYRDDGLDSKAMRSLYGPGQENSALAEEISRLQEAGTIGYLWANRDSILRKIPVNILQSLRWINQHVYDGAFAMGFMVFFVFSTWLLLRALYSIGWASLMLPALYIVLIMMALSLSFVHPRWIYQLVPFYVLLMAAGGKEWMDKSGLAKVVVIAVMSVFIFKTGSLAMDRLRDRWVDRNVIAIGMEMRKLMSKDELLMGFGPELAVQAKPDNPWYYSEMPYGSPGEVEGYAAEKNVRWIVLSSRNHAHYPVHQVYRDPAACPANWKLEKQVAFSGLTRKGEEQEMYYIFRREDNR